MKPVPCLLSLAILATAGAVRADDKPLNIYDWAEIFDEAVLSEFTRQTGTATVYDTYDSDETLETKLLTGGTGYDIVGPAAQPFLAREIQAGVLRELDRNNIPNWQYLDPALMKLAEQADPGNKFAIVYGWGTTGLGYNVEQIRKRLPDVPLDSYDLLFNPQNAAKLADCGIAMVDSPTDVMPIALKYLGLDPASERPVDLERAERLLMGIRPHLRYISSSPIITEMAAGEICLALGWSGDIVTARNRAAEAGSDVHVAYLIPKEGTLAWMATLAIPADAPNPAAANAFINYMLDPKVAAHMTVTTTYANAIPASRRLLPAEVANDPAIFPPEATVETLFLPGASTPEYDRLRTRSWTRFKTGQ
ncbi:extracellular solute-binding protein [Dongia sp.]|uniref:extracellular solute-binding protein n=1 Tax=Dongia sp. TaxID=1977262 RepID=UPI0035AF05B7